MSTGSWRDFMTHLEAVYLPSLAPAARTVPCPLEGVPDDIWMAAKLVFPDAVAWLDNPIPQFKGKSAHQMIKRGQDDKVREIIQNVSGFFLPPPDEVVPWEHWEQGTEVPGSDASGEAPEG